MANLRWFTTKHCHLGSRVMRNAPYHMISAIISQLSSLLTLGVSQRCWFLPLGSKSRFSEHYGRLRQLTHQTDACGSIRGAAVFVLQGARVLCALSLALPPALFAFPDSAYISRRMLSSCSGESGQLACGISSFRDPPMGQRHERHL